MITDAQIEAAAKSDATFDGRPWESMGRLDRERYLARSRAALEAAERAAWRPFSEAPENGTGILVFRPDTGEFIAYFVDDGWFSTNGEDLTGDLPTHFRPLPQPPGEEETR